MQLKFTEKPWMRQQSLAPSVGSIIKMLSCLWNVGRQEAVLWDHLVGLQLESGPCCLSLVNIYRKRWRLDEVVQVFERMLQNRYVSDEIG